jgi:hypothetical protein
MADVVAHEHNDNWRFDSRQTAGEKSDPLSSGYQNGDRDGFGSLLGDQQQPARKCNLKLLAKKLGFDTVEYPNLVQTTPRL